MRVQYSKQVLNELKRGGWSEARFVNLANVIAAYNADGYKPPANVMEFLQEFHYLKFRTGYLDEMNLDARTAASRVHPENVRHYGQELGAEFFPIGYFVRIANIYMSASSKFYCAEDNWLACIAESENGFFEKVFFEDSFKWTIINIAWPPKYD